MRGFINPRALLLPMAVLMASSCSNTSTPGIAATSAPASTVASISTAQLDPEEPFREEFRETLEKRDRACGDLETIGEDSLREGLVSEYQIALPTVDVFFDEEEIASLPSETLSGIEQWLSSTPGDISAGVVVDEIVAFCSIS